jgi:hypothetical protein
MEKINSVALVRERTIPTEQRPLVGEVSANFCGWRVLHNQRNGFQQVVNLYFLDRSGYFSFQVAPQLSSRGWVDPVPDPLLLTKSGSAGNRTRGLWICSREKISFGKMDGFSWLRIMFSGRTFLRTCRYNRKMWQYLIFWYQKRFKFCQHLDWRFAEMYRCCMSIPEDFSAVKLTVVHCMRSLAPTVNCPLWLT